MLANIVRLCVLCALLALPATATAAYPGTNGPIVFDLGDYLLRDNVDGADPVFITDIGDEENGAEAATVSADGSTLAIDSSTGNGSTHQVASMPLLTGPGAPKTLTGVQGFDPAILPEGNRV